MNIKITIKDGKLFPHIITNGVECPASLSLATQDNDAWHIYLDTVGKQRLCDTHYDTDKDLITDNELSNLNCENCKEIYEDIKESLKVVWEKVFRSPETEGLKELGEEYPEVAEDGASASILALWGHNMVHRQWLEVDGEEVSIKSVDSEVKLITTGETILGNPVYKLYREGTDD